MNGQTALSCAITAALFVKRLKMMFLKKKRIRANVPPMTKEVLMLMLKYFLIASILPYPI